MRRIVRIVSVYWPEIVGFIIGSILVALSACHTCPKPIPPPPVTVVAEPLQCDLPPLPLPLADPVGYPAPDAAGIYVSVSGWSKLAGYLLGLRNWIIAAQPCIGQPAVTTH